MNDNTRVLTFKGRKHSDATKEKMRLSKLGDLNPMKRKDVSNKMAQTLKQRGLYSGPNNPKWKGGGRKYRGLGWSKARVACRDRDNCTCQDCQVTEAEYGRTLDVHHIIDFKDGGSNDLSNLVTLCRSCHNKRRAGHGR